ncbi:hypothetical protein CEXT_279061 [Caerostris extrusa]|uniref:4Fe-4S ferredoxin-type domain-containing protein n=1 Tax=Caerostris extrusa TaxID=172846 RepID=A0AAV4Y140_CAEEX|nr:hypothetical protein CEXT_279061 [Caerostris extrusa]
MEPKVRISQIVLEPDEVAKQSNFLQENKCGNCSECELPSASFEVTGLKDQKAHDFERKDCCHLCKPNCRLSRRLRAKR